MKGGLFGLAVGKQSTIPDIQKESYKKMVTQVSPKPPALQNAVLAFVVGGIICAIGQLIQNFFMAQGMELKDAGTATTIVLVFFGAFLTGLGIYDDLGKYAGAGSIVPITGFANSIVASAMEYKREGFVYGVGAKMFKIAGPVLTYGFVTSVLIGLIYYVIKG